MIRGLATQHHVTVATLARSAAELADGEELRRHCQELYVEVIPPVAAWGRFLLHGVSAYPATFGYFYSAALARTVRKLLAEREFEAIVVHSSSMGPYVAGHAGCPKIMDFGDADSEKWYEYAREARFPLSLAFRAEGRKVRRYERMLGEDFDICTVNAPRERDVLKSYVRAPIHVIPNGVDLEYFKSARGGRARLGSRLVFTGNMSYRPNVDAVGYLVREILPIVRRSEPNVELYIVGMDPVPAVRALADGPRVVVTGRVEDVRPFLDEATVAVAPLRIARGLQNKVLESLAMGVPTVVSPAAQAGISATAGRDLVVAEEPEAFAAAVVSLLRDPEARDRLARAGRACVESNHNWDRALSLLEELLASASTGGGRAQRPSRR